MGLTSLDHTPTKPATERKRRQRDRQRLDEMVVQIVVRRPARDTLVEAKWIGEWDEDSREAVRDAVQRLVDGIQPVTRDAKR